MNEIFLFYLVDNLERKATLVPVLDWFWAIEASDLDVTILFTKF